MFLHDRVKKRVAGVFVPLFRVFSKLGVSAVELTMCSIVCKVAALVLLVFGDVRFALLAILFDYLFDLLDGAYARFTRTESRLGFFLDNGSDTLLRGAWFPAFAMIGLISWSLAWVSLGVLLLLFVVTMSMRLLPLRSRFPSLVSAMIIVPIGLLLGNPYLGVLVVLFVHGFAIVFNLLGVLLGRLK